MVRPLILRGTGGCRECCPTRCPRPWERRRGRKPVEQGDEEGVRVEEDSCCLEQEEVEVKAKVVKVRRAIEPGPPQHGLAVPSPQTATDLREEDLDTERVLEEGEDGAARGEDAVERVGPDVVAELRGKESDEAVEGDVKRDRA